MYILYQVIHCIFPLLALFFLINGIKNNAIYYVISSLWLSLIALIIHYEYSGGQILGSYFDYTNAFIYSFNLIVLCVSLICIFSHLSIDSVFFKYTSSLFKAFIVIGTLLVMTNLWTNAYFIENRLDGTPIIQIALMQKTDFCSYRYIFYKVSNDGSVSYLCPNHYGFVPSVGQLKVIPDFITTQLSLSVKRP